LSNWRIAPCRSNGGRPRSGGAAALKRHAEVTNVTPFVGRCRFDAYPGVAFCRKKGLTVMTAFASVSDVLARTGALLECESIVAFPDLAAWTVALGETDDFELALDERLGLIHVSAEVAPYRDDSDQDVLESLLEYNERWLATGGVRFGLDGARHRLTLTVSFPSASLEAEIMARRLARMERLVADWRRWFAEREREAARAASFPRDEILLKV
jgi:hypothetical protein